MVLLSELVLVSSCARPGGGRLFYRSFVGRAVANSLTTNHGWPKNPDDVTARSGQRIARMAQGMANLRKAGRSTLSSCDSEQRRWFSKSHSRSEDKKKPHTAESYFKDVDRAPPPSEKTYQVDSSNPTVQRPNEELSGEYSHAGPKTKEYATVEGATYDVPPSEGPEKDQKLRYGSTPRYYDEHSSGSNVSKREEGPEGASAAGRKPEGR